MEFDVFRDRKQAGQELAKLLGEFAARRDVLVLALPRGGIPVAYEVALALRAPLDVLVVRKLGVPGREEYAMGAIASGGIQVLDDDVTRGLHISAAAVDSVIRSERLELERRERLYRDGQPAPDLRDRTVILVDDGLATGSTMLAAVKAIHTQAPSKLVVAVPVAAKDACESLRREADEVICAATPSPFHAVGEWYEDFSQTSDDEVCRLLKLARQRPSPAT